MSKLVKDLVSQELRQRYADVDSVIWVELVGIDGITTNEFRRELHARRIRLEVVKNAWFRRAVGDRPLGALARALTGPAALLSGGDSLADVARTLEPWLKKLPGLKIRGAALEGQFLDAQAAATLSTLPTKREMQGRVVTCLRAPGARLAAAILSGGGAIAGCLKALTEKLEKTDAATAA